MFFGLTLFLLVNLFDNLNILCYIYYAIVSRK